MYGTPGITLDTGYEIQPVAAPPVGPATPTAHGSGGPVTLEPHRMRLMGARSYRVGRTLGMTLYAQIGDTPDKSDVLLALFDTRELAEQAAARLNDPDLTDLRWISIGRLIYQLGARMRADDFIATAVSADVAAALVSMVGG